MAGFSINKQKINFKFDFQTNLEYNKSTVGVTHFTKIALGRFLCYVIRKTYFLRISLTLFSEIYPTSSRSLLVSTGLI
jgi:hypothetical protein